MTKSLHNIFFLVVFWYALNPGFIEPGNANKHNIGNFLITGEDSLKTKLPFGCPLLVSHHFPREWEIPLEEDDSVKQPVNPHQQALQRISDFYEELIRVKSIPDPLIRRVQYIPIGYDKELRPYEQKFTAEFKYRLPNLGPYQCFYQQFEVPITYFYKLQERAFRLQSLGEDKLFLEYGNLVLYNPETKLAKILNIHNSYQYSGESPVAYGRLFYIARDGSIKIFEVGEGESSEAFRKAYEIKIKSNGVILINKFK